MAPVPGAPYTGPSVGEMLRSHTLAHEVIARHEDPCPIFDGAELAYLQDYIMDPSAANGAQLLEKHRVPDEAHGETGAGTSREGSLVGYIISREVQGDILLDEAEKAALRKWYADGKAEDRIRDWKEGKGE